MEMNHMVLVSVDDHICEPPDMFDRHLSGEALASAPKSDGRRVAAAGRGQRRRCINKVFGRCAAGNGGCATADHLGRYDAHVR